MVIYLILAYELQQLSGTPIRQSKEFISSDVLEIIKSSTLFSAEQYEKESIIESVTEYKTVVNPEKLVSLPREITKHQFLLNPVRLSIMKILSENTNYESSDIRKELGISWGKYTSHLTAMEKEGYISSQTDFVESNTRKIIQAEAKGLNAFEDLKQILYGLVFQSPVIS